MILDRLAADASGEAVSDWSVSGESVSDDGAPVRDLVHVWLVPTDQPPPVLGELAALLDDEERRRAAARRGAVQRARFVVAHGAARRIVAARLGLDPSEFAWRRGEHGKPEPDARGGRVLISTSHSAEVALVAVAVGEPGTAPREVGIDVERLVADHEAIRLAARFFPPDEAGYVASPRDHDGPAGRFATLWCRKEALVKAFGGRLVQGLALAAHGESPLVVRLPSDGERRADEYRVSDVPVPGPFRAAVALKGAAPFRLRCHVWSARTAVPPHYRSPD